MTQNGTAINQYLHQAAPGAAVVHFSDKPIKVDGIRYQPKWAWSDSYRKHFRRSHGRQPYFHGYAVQARSQRSEETTYRAWLFQDREIDWHGAQAIITHQRQLAGY